METSKNKKRTTPVMKAAGQAKKKRGDEASSGLVTDVSSLTDLPEKVLLKLVGMLDRESLLNVWLADKKLYGLHATASLKLRQAVDPEILGKLGCCTAAEGEEKGDCRCVETFTAISPWQLGRTVQLEELATRPVEQPNWIVNYVGSGGKTAGVTEKYVFIQIVTPTKTKYLALDRFSLQTVKTLKETKVKHLPVADMIDAPELKVTNKIVVLVRYEDCRELTLYNSDTLARIGNIKSFRPTAAKLLKRPKSSQVDLAHLQVSPDGRHIAFTAAITDLVTRTRSVTSTCLLLYKTADQTLVGNILFPDGLQDCNCINYLGDTWGCFLFKRDVDDRYDSDDDIEYEFYSGIRTGASRDVPNDYLRFANYDLKSYNYELELDYTIKTANSLPYDTQILSIDCLDGRVHVAFSFNSLKLLDNNRQGYVTIADVDIKPDDPKLDDDSGRKTVDSTYIETKEYGSFFNVRLLTFLDNSFVVALPLEDNTGWAVYHASQKDKFGAWKLMAKTSGGTDTPLFDIDKFGVISVGKQGVKSYRWAVKAADEDKATGEARAGGDAKAAGEAKAAGAAKAAGEAGTSAGDKSEAS